jgi:hypothetical protein
MQLGSSVLVQALLVTVVLPMLLDPQALPSCEGETTAGNNSSESMGHELETCAANTEFQVFSLVVLLSTCELVTTAKFGVSHLSAHAHPV